MTQQERILSERSIVFDFSRAVNARRFDDHLHGLSHCMKAVDFVVETDRRILLLEVKDFEDPDAQEIAVVRPHVAAQLQEDLEDFRQGRWTQSVFVQKCRDTLLYSWGTQQIDFTDPPKPIFYCVVIGLSNLQTAELLAEQDRLLRQIPLVVPEGIPWRNFIQGCAVFNLESWNRVWGADFPVSRR